MFEVIEAGTEAFKAAVRLLDLPCRVSRTSRLAAASWGP